MAVKPGAPKDDGLGIRPAIYGIAPARSSRLSAIGFRGGILALGESPFVLRATTTLAWSLGMQTALLLVWLAWFDSTALVKSFRAWKPSLFAGFLGAFASQFWFIGFRSPQRRQCAHAGAGGGAFRPGRLAPASSTSPLRRANTPAWA